jgi:hypothetical protein
MDLWPPCLQGYECVDGLCKSTQAITAESDAGEVFLSSDGTGGTGAGGGGGGSDSSGGVAGTPALGGAGSEGGSLPDIPDASVILDGGPDGCVPVDLYRDRDDDGVGDTAKHAFGCIRAGWVEIAGDCRDDIVDVHPGQLEFFGTGFPDPLQPGGVSFDYDCSNTEETAISNSPAVAAKNCQGLSLLGLACEGSGYQKTAREPGAGVNNLCGSQVVVDCVTSGLSCVPRDLAVQERFKCH